MARFRCCGNYNTDGHAEDCSLKPTTTPPPERKPPKADDEEGCRFDILHFEHIGECKGTCGKQGKAIQFADESTGELKILIIMVDGELDEETLKEMEERGLRRLTEQEMEKIVEATASGHIEVDVQVLSLEEIRAKFPRREEAPNPFLSVKDAAKELQFSESWVRKLCAKGRLAGAMKLERWWAIPRDAIYMKEEEA